MADRFSVGILFHFKADGCFFKRGCFLNARAFPVSPGGRPDRALVEWVPVCLWRWIVRTTADWLMFKERAMIRVENPFKCNATILDRVMSFISAFAPITKAAKKDSKFLCCQLEKITQLPWITIFALPKMLSVIKCPSYSLPLITHLNWLLVNGHKKMKSLFIQVHFSKYCLRALTECAIVLISSFSLTVVSLPIMILFHSLSLFLFPHSFLHGCGTCAWILNIAQITWILKRMEHESHQYETNQIKFTWIWKG